MPWRGRLWDGYAAEGQEVRVAIEDRWLRVDRESLSPQWWGAELVRASARAGGGVRLELTGRTERPLVLEVEDAEFAAAWGAVAVKAPAARRDTAQAFDAWPLVGLIGGGVVALYLVFAVGIPWLAAALAQYVPVEWEEKLGRQTVAMMAPRRCEEAQPYLDRVTSRLLNAAENNPYRFEFRVAPMDIPNAFAAPGGSIVVTVPLLQEMETPEELAAVLAHEIQHVLQRHTTRNLVKQATLQLLAVLVLGDVSGMAANLATSLGALSYQRSDELEADHMGMELLERAGVDSAAMARMLERLQKLKDQRGGEVPAFLSTHPATSERIGIAKERGRAGREDVLLLNDRDWAAMKRACVVQN